jgi:hypothetical protein
MSERLRKATIVALAFLCWIVPLKFTQPVLFYDFVYWPQVPPPALGGSSNYLWDLMLVWFYNAWPTPLFYALFVPIAIVGLIVGNWKKVSPWIWTLPICFFLSQLLAGMTTVHWPLTKSVLLLSAALSMGYLLGGIVIRDRREVLWILSGCLIASVYVLVSGISQAQGGLEETRRFLQAHPEFAHGDPNIFKKVESDRIFSVFINPNMLGGYISSALFFVAAWGMGLTDYFKRTRLNWILSGGIGLALLYCLLKSQSKGAYAVFFISLAIGVLLLIPRRRMALMILAALFGISLFGFGLGYGRKAVDKGIKTWGARVGYWKAAVEIGKDYPLLGSGPGTFSVMYPRYKNLEDEDTRLVHNNYLQMWSDSGVLGFVSFFLWFPGSLAIWWWRNRNIPPQQRVVSTLIWCGCLAFALHSLVDFDLYLLSNSWPIFVLTGYLAVGERLTGRTV